MTYTIGEISKITGLSIRTLRYYEDVDVLLDIDRTEFGHRIYTEDDLSWIEILKCLRATDMPIKTIQEFVVCMKQGDDTARQRRIILEEHRTETLKQLAEVQAALARIDEKIEKYRQIENAHTVHNEGE